MLEPQITLQDVGPSEKLEATIRKKIAKLSQYYNRINSCRVVVEATQRHQHQGKLFNVRIELTVPERKQVVASHKQDEDVYVALREAFDATVHQLEEFVGKRNDHAKSHAQYLSGQIVRLFKEEGYGFIEAVDGTEYYFNDSHVHHITFDQLMIGDEVYFTPEPSSEGWQAHHVTKGKHHPLDETY